MSGLAARARNTPCSPPQGPVVVVRSGSRGSDLKALSLSIEQLTQKAVGLRVVLRLNQIGQSERSRGVGAAAQQLLHGRVERGDNARRIALQQANWGVLEQRTQFRFRIVRRPAEFSNSTHASTLRGKIPG